ncbi:MAG: peptidoglycan bridge formation glycyltransferase FemA/FemB family protein, partial [Candidatus Falkowbacteria bacterium]|nr:peptidoglycan bridge formation glycyltransferase FemA/FemB family protein [Candidatus Falkowbacteria bacterium]
MRIVNNINKEKWNEFIGTQKQSQFLQSWEWGELAEKEGAKILRVGIEDAGELVAVASLVKKNIFGFNYWFCPRGPVVSYKEVDKVIKFLFDEIEKLAKQEKIIFLRFEPLLEIANWKLQIEKTIDIEPNKTAIIDLNRNEDELLNAM